jgi:hypothetical protein
VNRSSRPGVEWGRPPRLEVDQLTYLGTPRRFPLRMENRIGAAELKVVPHGKRANGSVSSLHLQASIAATAPAPMS